MPRIVLTSDRFQNWYEPTLFNWHNLTTENDLFSSAAPAILVNGTGHRCSLLKIIDSGQSPSLLRMIVQLSPQVSLNGEVVSWLSHIATNLSTDQPKDGIDFKVLRSPQLLSDTGT